MHVETVEFNGHKYRRYPESEIEVNRKYFQRGGGKGFLHRHIWEYYFGPIPENCHIHHLDNDTGNNELNNLCLISGQKHLSDHGKKTMLRKMEEDPNWLLHLKKIRVKASEWHSSEEGIEWHKKHAVKTIQSRPIIEIVCDNCNSTFKTQGNGRDRFCSNKCKSAYRRKMKIDYTEMSCVMCGNTFETDKYKPKQTCSRKCANSLNSRTKRKGLYKAL